MNGIILSYTTQYDKWSEETVRDPVFLTQSRIIKWGEEGEEGEEREEREIEKESLTQPSIIKWMGNDLLHMEWVIQASRKSPS